MQKSKIKYQKCAIAAARHFIGKFLNFALCTLIFEFI